MVPLKRLCVVIVMLTLAVACASNERSGDPKDAAPDSSDVRSEADADLPPASVLIAHRISDYETWKSVFDGHMQARKDASCLGHYLKQGVDDPDMVFVYCLAADVDELRAFLESADLAEAMKHAGVEGVPEITLMKPMSRNLVPEQRLPGIIVMHPVEDYASWRKAYDDFDEFRRKSGIVGHAVSQEYDNPDNVIVYHQANDLTNLREFVHSEELANVMQSAGVAGDPDIRFIQVVDFAKY